MSLGLVNGNYSGVNSSIINPALMANSKLKWDVNLVSLNAFVENNYLYFPSRQSSAIKLFNGDYDFHFFPKPYGTGERRVYTYYNDKSLKNIFVNSRILGPSVMFSVKKHVFAIRTGFRIMSSSRRLPYDMANFSYYGMDFKPQHNIQYAHDNYDITGMAWWELSFSYATVFNRSYTNHWSAGISVGPVFGNSGAYLSGGETNYIAYNDSILNAELFNGEYGIAMPLNYNTNGTDYNNQLVRGYGWGMDIGITWQYRDRPYQRKFSGSFYKKSFEEYRIKVGLSLLDIGWVKYTENAQKHVFNNVSNNSINVNELDFENLQDEMNTISELFYGDPNTSLNANDFKIFMPATVSLQIDYHIIDCWYLNSTVILPAKYSSPMIERPFVLAVSPRFESRFLEINVPLILYDYKYPHVGLSVRIEGLTVGSDNLGGFFNISDFTGADVYVSYKVSMGTEGINPYSSKGACFNNWCQKKTKKEHYSFF